MKRIILCSALLPLGAFAMNPPKLSIENKSRQKVTVYYTSLNNLMRHMTLGPKNTQELELKIPQCITVSLDQFDKQNTFSILNTDAPIVIKQHEKSLINITQNKEPLMKTLEYLYSDSSDSTSSESSTSDV